MYDAGRNSSSVRCPVFVRWGCSAATRGSAAFGSDLDLLLVDAQASGGQIERLQVWPLGDLPLSCDALVLTPEELDQRLSDGTRMAAELRRDLRWML